MYVKGSLLCTRKTRKTRKTRWSIPRSSVSVLMTLYRYNAMPVCFAYMGWSSCMSASLSEIRLPPECTDARNIKSEMLFSKLVESTALTLCLTALVFISFRIAVVPLMNVSTWFLYSNFWMQSDSWHRQWGRNCIMVSIWLLKSGCMCVNGEFKKQRSPNEFYSLIAKPMKSSYVGLCTLEWPGWKLNGKSVVFFIHWMCFLSMSFSYSRPLKLCVVQNERLVSKFPTR